MLFTLAIMRLTGLPLIGLQVRSPCDVTQVDYKVNFTTIKFYQ